MILFVYFSAFIFSLSCRWFVLHKPCNNGEKYWNQKYKSLSHTTKSLSLKFIITKLILSILRFIRILRYLPEEKTSRKQRRAKSATKLYCPIVLIWHDWFLTCRSFYLSQIELQYLSLNEFLFCYLDYVDYNRKYSPLL